MIVFQVIYYVSNKGTEGGVSNFEESFLRYMFYTVRSGFLEPQVETKLGFLP